MKLSLVCVGVLFAAACGGDDGGEPTPVQVNAKGAKVAAVFDGTKWTPIALDATTGVATVDVDRPTLVAAVCDDPDYFNYYTIAVGPGSDEPLEMYCADSYTPVLIDIVAPESTTVAIGFSRTNGGDVAFARAGTYDIVATDLTMSPPRVEIRRGVALTADTSLTFDLATAGTPMTKVTATVTGLAGGETANTYTTVRIGPAATPTIASWSSANADLWVVPESLRAASDRHALGASTAIDLDNSRNVSRKLDSATTYTLALPPYVATANVTLGATPSLAWTAADPAAFDRLYFGINSPDFGRLWDTAILPSWIEAGGDPSKLTIPDPQGIPGWNPAWNLPATTTDFEWSFFADRVTDTEQFSAMRAGKL